MRSSRIFRSSSLLLFFKVVVDLANRYLKLCQCFLIWFNEEPILRSSLEESPVLEILHNYGVIRQKALYFTGHGLDICKIMWSKWNILDYCIWGVDACKMLFLFQNHFFYILFILLTCLFYFLLLFIPHFYEYRKHWSSIIFNF